jgi:hypothetical protein
MKTSRPPSQLWRRHGGVCVRSDDGVLEFRLASCTTGLFVERVEQRDHQARIVQSTIFSDAMAFDRWCDADTVRFDYPMLYVALKRNADNVLR